MKSLNYKTLDDALQDLGAVNRGSYFTCICPHCGKKEAFFYLTDKDSFVVKCNRLSHCGQTTKVLFGGTKKEKESIIQKFKDSYDSKKEIDISSKGKERLMSFLNSSHKKDVPPVFRGISKETLENYIIFYPKGVHTLFGKPEEKLFGKKYFRKLYRNRDIIIPIRNKDGIPERCFLRTTKKLTGKTLKEFQLRIVDKGNEIWNVADIYDPQKEFIFVCEGVWDALSVLDVLGGTLAKDKIGVVALAGVGKHSQITRILKENPDIAKKKTFCICFDLDKAGMKEGFKFYCSLRKLHIGVRVFNYLNYNAPITPLEEKIEGYPWPGTLDFNDWYQKDPEGFTSFLRDLTWIYQ